MRAAPAFVLEVNRLTYRRCFRSRGERHFCFCSTIPGDDDISVSVLTSRCKALLCTNVMSRVSGRLASESAEPEERETPPLMVMLERPARFFPHLAVVRLQDRSESGQLRLCLRLRRNSATLSPWCRWCRCLGTEVAGFQTNIPAQLVCSTQSVVFQKGQRDVFSKAFTAAVNHNHRLCELFLFFFPFCSSAAQSNQASPAALEA